MENSGISISGGSVTAGAMAAGDHAVARNEVAPPSEAALADLREAVRRLTQLVAERTPSPDAPDLVMARLAEQEVARETPDKGRLMGLLQALSSGAGAVTGVAGAVAAVEKAVQAVL